MQTLSIATHLYSSVLLAIYKLTSQNQSFKCNLPLRPKLPLAAEIIEPDNLTKLLYYTLPWLKFLAI